MKKRIISLVISTSLYVAAAQAATVSCPDLPEGTYTSSQKINGWILWLGQSGNLVLAQDFRWPTTAGNYKGTQYIYSLNINNNPLCHYLNPDLSKRFSLRMPVNAKCSVTRSGQDCRTNSFITL